MDKNGKCSSEAGPDRKSLLQVCRAAENNGQHTHASLSHLRKALLPDKPLK